MLGLQRNRISGGEAARGGDAPNLSGQVRGLYRQGKNYRRQLKRPLTMRDCKSGSDKTSSSYGRIA